jgi:hypothetical protein
MPKLTRNECCKLCRSMRQDQAPGVELLRSRLFVFLVPAPGIFADRGIALQQAQPRLLGSSCVELVGEKCNR